MFIKPNVEKIRNAGQIDKLLLLLNHRKSQIRESAMAALFDIAGTDKDVVAEMRKLLNDKDMKVRHRAALIFARMGDTGVIDNLYEVITRGTVNEQIEVLRLLPHYFSKENKNITQILALALKDKKPSVQIEAIRSIGEMGIETMAFYLLDFANHSVAKFRLETVIALGRIKNPIGIDVLIGALTDSSPEVRKIAAESLKSVGTDKALNSLKDAPFMLMVKNMNESVSKRLTTVINIGKQKNLLGLPLLRKACYDDYKNIRIESIKSLAVLKDDSSLPTLIELLEDKYYDVRIETIKALTRFNSMSALNALKTARNDPNTNVKLEAKRAYAALSSRMNIVDRNE